MGDLVERSLAAEKAARGSVIIAPTGSLALKRQRALRTEYHILGTFSMVPPTALQSADDCALPLDIYE